MEHPVFEIVTTTTGAISIRNKVVNEIMHNPVGPWVEANALYIDQSRLRERLTDKSAEEFVIFDIGLGAAANAIAALSCLRLLGTERRPVRMISFERDLDLLRFALDHAREFTHFHGFEKALKTLLETGHWQEPGFIWDLREGDFLTLIESEAHRPHLVFFDPYSPKVNQEMWTTHCFAKLFGKARNPEQGGTDLYTYSQATRIRVALLIAGFHVGYGQATGLKNQTTQAASDMALLKTPLDRAWFERWRRSHIRYPFDCSPEEQAAADTFVENYLNRINPL
ncbi:MAG: MnmC family methyltransferase [Bdellovibrio sp.]